MATVAIQEIATQSANLRAELKEWERAFADANGGRKAARNDIKKVPEIAAKYKEYSRLKALETSTSTSTSTSKLEERPKKRKHPSDTTPRKASKHAFETPSKARTAHPATVDPYDSPSVLRRLFSPSTHLPSASPLKTAIGPTPQRDGKALGLFDLLSESGGSTATPSATRVASVRDTGAQTPSRRRKRGVGLDTIAEEGGEGEEGEDEEDSPRVERTPASSGKKWMLSTLFATPTTWRYAAMMEDGDGKGGMRVPARSTSGRYDAGGEGGSGGLSPMAARKRPRFVGKGLSALVQGLRDMEEERLQDDWDVLNEIEAEQNAQVMDSQAVPSGEHGHGDSGRVYKKKGQKRTTRNVHMKPVVSKPKAQSKAEPELEPSEKEEEEGDLDESVVPDTQALDALAQGPEEMLDLEDMLDPEDFESLHSMSEPDFDSDPDYDEASKPLTRGKSFSEKMKEAIAAGKPQQEQPQEKKPKAETKEEEEDPKSRVRKVNPAAHANYRSLKIRNRGSKGRGAGRFRRR
ncbi:hypothetical protein BO70DRAFT_384121 [Aspergillus heteromorphus CBS 117.55]|uniref:DNA replication regulator SLD2 n=1 Tax=Aspergillus heteromorphus CBS 117.55 TaxID=1448321 RepID=A0A317X6Z2_9EURO|nr:uncharacterized protein BO70DRAFT_384121 [Aspergillus heteromorphus CBS 117.55]PWY92648.1 hypothetical protein BO70DRAFT_384121 [Aspergillus heteromorphus CBS 117.55]